jgi:superfamily II DNA/RNA helicase
MSDKAQRRAQSRKASTSGRVPGEEFLRMGVDDRVTVRLLHAGSVTMCCLRAAFGLLCQPTCSHFLPQVLLDSLGIMSPTEVQAASIPKVLEGRNVGIQCYTGSGKVLPSLCMGACKQ